MSTEVRLCNRTRIGGSGDDDEDRDLKCAWIPDRLVTCNGDNRGCELLSEMGWNEDAIG